MKRPVRRRWMWPLRFVLAVLVVLTLSIGALVFPQPLFAHWASIGSFRVYSDTTLPADLARVIEEAAWRIRAMEPPAGRPGVRVYLCNDPRRYRFFAFLARKSSLSLAIGLSATNSIFVSVDRVERFRQINTGVLRHTRFEGNLAEVIAHEVAHFASVRALGYRAHLAQPVWKSEGWAEYQANLAAIRADPAYDLAERVDQLLDRRYWAISSGLARDLWEWQLLVEYLAGVEGYRLGDLVRQDVTLDVARSRMMSWREARLEQRGIAFHRGSAAKGRGALPGGFVLAKRPGPPGSLPSPDRLVSDRCPSSAALRGPRRTPAG